MRCGFTSTPPPACEASVCRASHFGACPQFGVAFAKQYIAAGRLRHGRALLIVSTAVGGTGFFGLGQG